jgi:hypothetical protein
MIKVKCKKKKLKPRQVFHYLDNNTVCMTGKWNIGTLFVMLFLHVSLLWHLSEMKKLNETIPADQLLALLAGF